MKSLQESYGQSYKLDEIIFHIPHSSSLIPEYSGYLNMEDVQNEINIVTDWYSEEIFNIKNISKIITPYSKVFCDVSKLPDEFEVTAKEGRGFFYTRNHKNKPFRKDSNRTNLKTFVKEEYYDKHHEELNSLVEDKLNRNDKVIIIDCHTFTQKHNSDICIASSIIKTPLYLTDYFSYFFSEHNYDISINDPYETTIIPFDYIEDSRVNSVLVGINKNLYLNSDYSKKEQELMDLRYLISDLVFNLLY
jgi:N-formylglutamate amidohydrolase